MLQKTSVEKVSEPTGTKMVIFFHVYCSFSYQNIWREWRCNHALEMTPGRLQAALQAFRRRKRLEPVIFFTFYRLERSQGRYGMHTCHSAA